MPETEIDIDSPLEEIDRMNLATTANMARTFYGTAGDIPIPELDIALFLEHVPGKSMLDVGCGWGRFVERFVNADMDYVGIDYCEEMLVEARRRNPLEIFRLGNYHQLDTLFPNERFDGIWASFIFGMQPKRFVPQVLLQMRALLVPGGIVYFTFRDDLEGGEDICDARDGLGRMYFTNWDLTEFEEVLKAAGFGTVYAEHHYGDGSMTVVGKKL